MADQERDANSMAPGMLNGEPGSPAGHPPRISRNSTSVNSNGDTPTKVPLLPKPTPVTVPDIAGPGVFHQMQVLSQMQTNFNADLIDITWPFSLEIRLGGLEQYTFTTIAVLHNFLLKQHNNMLQLQERIVFLEQGLKASKEATTIRAATTEPATTETKEDTAAWAEGETTLIDQEVVKKATPDAEVPGVAKPHPLSSLAKKVSESVANTQSVVDERSSIEVNTTSATTNLAGEVTKLGKRKRSKSVAANKSNTNKIPSATDGEDTKAEAEPKSTTPSYVIQAWRYDRVTSEPPDASQEFVKCGYPKTISVETAPTHKEVLLVAITKIKRLPQQFERPAYFAGTSDLRTKPGLRGRNEQSVEQKINAFISAIKTRKPNMKKLRLNILAYPQSEAALAQRAFERLGDNGEI